MTNLRHLLGIRWVIIAMIFFILFSIPCIGQTKKIPRNIRQAIKILNSDCPDSLKSVIKQTDDNKLIRLCYPWDGEFKTIYEWIKHDSPNSGISKYLIKKGISYNEHQQTVILIAFKRNMLGQLVDEDAIFKKFQIIERKWAQKDSIRFMADSLRGEYIPKDLDDCFRQIDVFWNDSTKEKVKKWTEDEFSGRAHMSFGMWMRNNWQLWGGSRLSKYFNEKGIYHPDDMSGIILDSYHRYLNNKEIRLDEQIKYYQDYWEKSEKERTAREMEQFDKYHVADTVLFNFKFDYTSDKQEDADDEETCVAKGLILEKDSLKFLLKILLFESCDRKGIIVSDNKDYEIYNKKTKQYEPPKKRKRKYMKKGQALWLPYSYWDVND